MIYRARDLVHMPKEELWALPDGKIAVEMDDGVVKSTKKKTIFSVYSWELVKHFPDTPLLKMHHMGDRAFTDRTMQDLLNAVLWSCKDLYGDAADREVLETITGAATNQFYNDLTYKLEPYVQSLSILDFIDVVVNPKVTEINDNLEPNYRSIDNAHRRVTKILMDPNEMPNNRVAVGCRIGIFKIGQVVQCVSARGYLTDIDNNIFRYPILRGYVHGFKKLYDLMIDSRSASKSLNFTEKPLQESQYFNRRLQLITDTITDLIPGDCGSTRYLTWFVLPEQLTVFDGKYYVDDKQLKRFDASTAASLGLLGKPLHFRSALFCDSMHPRGICEVCFGELRHAIVAGTNPGHVACTKLGERISQIILSTKHLDRSASTNSLEISETNLKYIKYDEERNAIAMADNLDPTLVTLTISADEAGRLADVMYVDDVALLQTSLVSSITRAQFTIKRKRGEENPIVPLSSGKRLASLSKDFLNYIKQVSWSLTPNGNYSIDMKGWDQDLPMFTLPLKNANMLDYMKGVESFLKGSKSGVSSKSIRQCTTPEEALRELYDIVSTQLKINIAYLELMIFACMVRSPKNLDYRLPLPGNSTCFDKFATVVAGRSMSAVLAYEYQRNTLSSPQTYLIRYRPNHPLDQIIEAEPAKPRPS